MQVLFVVHPGFWAVLEKTVIQEPMYLDGHDCIDSKATGEGQGQCLRDHANLFSTRMYNNLIRTSTPHVK